MKRLKYCLAVALLAAGCATKPIEVPHVFIPGAPPDVVRSAMIQREVPKGWKVDKETQSEISFSRPLTGLGAALLFGSQYDGTPNARMHCTLASGDGGTHVYLTAEIVTNPGSAFERITPDTNRRDVAAELAALEEMKASLAK